MARKDFLPKKRGKSTMLISRETLEAIQERLKRPEVVMDERQFAKAEKAGKVHYRYLVPQQPQQRPGGGGSKPPFWPTLFIGESSTEEAELFLTMVPGFVMIRKNAGGDAVAMLTVTGIPGDPDPEEDKLSVAVGDKIYCEIYEDSLGLPETAVIGKALTWPVSQAPQLIGGDSSGTTGIRYIRICEIITEEDRPKVRPLLTGHIDHFQPALLDNDGEESDAGSEEPVEDSTPSTLARVLKEFSAGAGKWIFRLLTNGKGQLTVTEGNSDIEIRGNKRKGVITYTIGDDYPVDLIRFNDGLFMEGAIEEDPAAPVEEQIFNISIPECGCGSGSGSTSSSSSSRRTIYHPWKVTPGGVVEGSPTWNVKGGTVLPLGQGADIVVPDTILTGTGEFVLLNITRDTSTREITGAELILADAVEPSDESEQVLLIAIVGGDPEVEQHQFEDIRILEELLVVNGAFKFAVYQMMHYNNYDLPEESE